MAQYISASRRTDLPRFGYESFFAAWQQGAITYDGGYGRSYTVSLQTRDVLGYIFWSKDYTPFINHPLFPSLIAENNAIFHYTINDYPPLLEPQLASCQLRLETLDRLCEQVDASRVLWRFDPICKYRDSTGRLQSTHETFFRLAPRIAGTGVTQCFFSFMTDYAKLRSRSVAFEPFDPAEMVSITASLQHCAADLGIRLHACCMPEPVCSVPGVVPAHCVDEQLLATADRFHRHVPQPLKPSRPGCGCYHSRDIGSYNPPCPHGCVYCYANPCRQETPAIQLTRHDC